MRFPYATPGFSKPLRTPDYFRAVDEIVVMLRPASTLRTIAARLNAHGLQTPSGLDWNRERVSQYIRHRKFNSTTEKDNHG